MFQRVEWPNLYAHLSQTWQQGQHGVAMAPTGRGKTVLVKELVKLRSHVAFFGTKIKDEEYQDLRKNRGWTRLQKWPPMPWQDRVMLWPSAKSTIRETTAHQKQIFQEALDHMYRAGKWTAVFDELHWMTHDLGLYNEIASLHHQGRSSGLTLISGFQRPAFVPRIVYSSATHLFIWGTNDPADLKQLAAFTGVRQPEWHETMPTLGDFEFVYTNVRDRSTPPVISQVRR